MSKGATSSRTSSATARPWPIPRRVRCSRVWEWRPRGDSLSPQRRGPLRHRFRPAPDRRAQATHGAPVRRIVVSGGAGQHREGDVRRGACRPTVRRSRDPGPACGALRGIHHTSEDREGDRCGKCGGRPVTPRADTARRIPTVMTTGYRVPAVYLPVRAHGCRPSPMPARTFRATSGRRLAPRHRVERILFHLKAAVMASLRHRDGIAYRRDVDRRDVAKPRVGSGVGSGTRKRGSITMSFPRLPSVTPQMM